MTLSIELIKPKVYRVKASSREELALTFLRFQEYYESPKFKSKIFTLGQFRDWYIKQNGSFSYPQDWTGFNIPSWVLEPFKQGLFDPLTKQELVFLNKFKNKKGNFYIIGSNDNSETLRHELSHALFFTNTAYRSRVVEILSKFKKQTRSLELYLKKIGYHRSVIEDEVNAYITTSSDFLSLEGIKVNHKLKSQLMAARRKFLYSWK